MNKKELKISFTDQTKVNLKNDDSTVPLAEDFCVNVKALTELPIGS